MLVNNNLVGDLSLLKNDKVKVSWVSDDIPYMKCMKWNIKTMFETTNQNGDSVIPIAVLVYQRLL